MGPVLYPDAANTRPWPSTKPNYRPEIGSYLSNIYAAARLFQHSLFDRAGNMGQSDSASTGWVRISGGNRSNMEFNGLMDNNIDTALIQFGGDVCRTPLSGTGDELRIGLMAGYGNVSSDTSSLGNRRHSSSDVDGFAAGGYATWFAQADRRQGAYVNIWALDGWQRNQVQGDHLPEQTYHSNTINASLETGYIWVPQPDRHWYIAPQLQAIWSSYQNGSHTEHNTGLDVDVGNIDGCLTRAGVRVFGDIALANGSTLQPYAELNWLRDDARFNAAFNQRNISLSSARQMGELKLGIGGYVTPSLQVWGEANMQQGENDYRADGGMLGAKYLF